MAVNRFESAGLVAFYERRDSDGSVDALLFLDRVDAPMFGGVDSVGLQPVDIGSIPAWGASNGSYRASVVGWTDDEGHVRAWGTGLDLDETVDAITRVLTDPSATDFGDGWNRSSAFVGGAGGGTNRFHFIDDDGVGVVTVADTPAESGLSLVDSTGCSEFDGRVGCSGLVAWVDDGVEIVIAGTSETRTELADRIRPVDGHNTLISQYEYTPWVSLGLVEDEQVLLVSDSAQWVAETQAFHWSGAMVSEPGLVLVERTHAEIGRITSGVVVDVLADGQPAELPGLLDRASAVVVIELGGRLVRLTGWNHSPDELSSLAGALTYSSVDGLGFANRGLDALGVERRYFAEYRQKFPRSVHEGLVYTATYLSPAGLKVTQRVSQVPWFSSASAMVKPHDNSDLEIEVQGRPAAVLEYAGSVSLSWEHEPGTVVTLAGTNLSDLVELGDLLEWGDARRDVDEGDSGLPSSETDQPQTVAEVPVVLESVGRGTIDRYPDSATYPVGSTVQFFAVPDPGYELVEWTIGGETNTELSVRTEVTPDLAVNARFARSADPEPGIDFWYGNQQTFGRDTQRWVNILGTATLDSSLVGMSYSVNGGPTSRLAFGPDQRRNDGVGDFNIEIPVEELRAGVNNVTVLASDAAGRGISASMELIWNGEGDAPIDAVVWGELAELLDGAQPIDGEWLLSGGVLRTAEAGYERMIGLGQPATADYEVTVPITVHATGTRVDQTLGGSAWVGLGLNWSGHSDGAPSSEPRLERWPTGAFASYRFGEPGQFRLIGNESDPISVSENQLVLGRTYLFKVRVRVVADGVVYSFKVWEQGRSEPAGWTNEIHEVTGPRTGSVVLVAHHVDASFGDVTVEPVSIDETQVEESRGRPLNIGIAGHGSVSTSIEPENYELGTIVEVSAWPTAGQRFIGWTGDIESGDDTVEVTLGDEPVNLIAEFSAESNGIDVWYGLKQRFGTSGVPQTWINIVGNASDPDEIASLTYRLNGGRIFPLSVGNRHARLHRAGDFNVELPITELNYGANTVEIGLTDTTGETVVQKVAVIWEPERIDGLPLTLDWASEPGVVASAQVVDGLWAIVDDQLRIVEPGYDRSVAIGDVSMTDYVVEVPVTINSLSYETGSEQQGQPVVGLALRWNGHTQTRQTQPSDGFEDAGGYALWRPQPDPTGRLDLLGSGFSPDAQYEITLDYGTTYVFKAEVVTLDIGTRYRVKVWPEAAPEPATWSTEIIEPAGPISGSVLLIARHYDASFGPVAISPIGE